jgi:penicillin-binding protein
MRKIKLGFLIALCLLLGACAQTAETTYDITGYLEDFAAMDYAGMYAQTLPTADINEESFVGKYDAVFSGLGVKSIVISGVSEPDADGYFTYTATYQTESYGDFTNDFTLRAVHSGGQCVVMWEPSLIFPEMTDGCTVRVETVSATRGEIFAADGSLLAENTYADTLYMNTLKVQDILAVADAVAQVSEVGRQEIIDMFNAAVEDGTEIVVIDTYYRDELTDTQQAALLAVPGLGIDDKMYTPIRDYPMKEAAAHILGYTGYADEDDIAEGYSASDRLGVTGLEKSYETALRGVNGKIVYIRDKWGDTVRMLYEEPMTEGTDLRLTIKPMLQRRAYDALAENLQDGQTGVAIVMDASTGYVEGMASYPSYDDNLFTFPVSDADWEALTSDESNTPMFSRATQGRYPPGSVIKPFTAAIALEDGAISADTVFDGEITADNKWYPEGEGWSVTRIDDSGSPLKLDNGMIHSDNIYFAFAALKVGEEAFRSDLEDLGMSSAVPFDLPVMAANTVNTMMTPKLLADMGYGQGELLVTPIQMAAMYTAFAGGNGDMMTPILVQKTCRTDGLDYLTLEEREGEVWISDAISTRSIDTLTPILQEVINHGTGYGAKIRGINIAGKTGTAEIGDDKSREISWFAGYWLDGSYDRLVVVMVDVAAEAGNVKFDIAKELLTP